MASILVADDEPHVRKLVQVNLERAGHEVSQAGEGQEVLEAVAAGLPDALVLDVMMPYMDGIEVLQRLREDPATASLPVIMMTAKSAYGGEDAFYGFLDREVDYLVKPFNPLEMLKKVEWVLRRRRPAPLVLVADDERDIRLKVAEHLRAAGLRAMTAADGKEALELVSRYHPELLVLDVMMPRMDGFEVLKCLKADPQTASIPIIMMTARCADGDVFRGWTNGVDAHVTKPLNPRLLVDMAIRALQLEAG